MAILKNLARHPSNMAFNLLPKVYLQMIQMDSILSIRQYLPFVDDLPMAPVGFPLSAWTPREAMDQADQIRAP